MNDENLYTKTYNGAFVAVQNFNDKVYISQDFAGCWGLYLFRSGDYWAISTSFLYLVEYLKNKFALTPNVDYMKDFMLRSFATASVKDTLIKEIELIPRFCSVVIEKSTKKMSLFKKQVEDETLDLDSEKGIEALDVWYYTWTSFIRNLAAKNAKIQIDLSGGMDSRLTFLLLLCSGIDLNKTRIHSIEDTVHTHSDDFAIASEMAKKYGFALNKEINVKRKPFSLKDTIKLSFYTKLGLHKEMYFKYGYWEEPIFWFSGAGGESVREYDAYSFENSVDYFKKQTTGKIARMNYDLLSGSKYLFNNAKECLANLYSDIDIEGKGFSHYLYKHGELMRHHFGKACVGNYLCNVMGMAPLMDSNIQKIKFNSENGFTLLATIFMRYKPDLLDFRYDGGRTVEEKAFEAAKKINEKYPFVDSEEKRALYSNRNVIFDYKPFASEETVPNKEPIQITDYQPFSTQRNVTVYADPLEWCKKLFRSNFVKRNFCQILPKRIYDFAEERIQNRPYFPLSEAYAVIAIAKTVYDTNYSQGVNRDDAFDFLNAMAELPDDGAGEDENLYVFGQISSAFETLHTARLDIKLENPKIPNSNIALEVVSPKEKCTITTPQWFSKDGTGYVVECSNYEMELKAKCKNDGVLKFFLRAKDARSGGKRIPLFVDYGEFCVGKKTIFTGATPCSHDKPFRYEMKVRAGKEIRIRLRWNVHKGADGESEEILRKVMER